VESKFPTATHTQNGIEPDFVFVCTVTHMLIIVLYTVFGWVWPMESLVKEGGEGGRAGGRGRGEEKGENVCWS